MNEIQIALFMLGALFGLLGFIGNIVVIVIGWLIKRQIMRLDESIATLTTEDKALLGKIEGVAKDLADYKLHAANTFVRGDKFDEVVDKLFDRLETWRTEMVIEVKNVYTSINDRINRLHEPHGGGQ